MKAFIRESDVGNGVELFVAERTDQDGGLRVLEPAPKADDQERWGGHWTVRDVRAEKPGHYGLPDPWPFMSGRMAQDFVQAVLDAAWASGMRPNGISGERGEIRRLEEHLQDMRALAFGRTGVEKP